MEDIEFHPGALFGTYRADASQLHSTEALLSVPNKRRRVVDSDDDDDNCDDHACTNDELQSPARAAPEVEWRDDSVVDQALARQPCAVYDLFRYLSEETVSRLAPQIDELKALLRDRCHQLLPEVERQSTQIRVLWHTMVRRMLLEILAEDVSGLKIREMRQSMEEPYLLVAGARANLANLDRVRQLTLETARDALKFEKDDFYKQRSGPKKRGRRRADEKRPVLNQMQQVLQRYITSRKVPGQIDLYPAAVKVLTVVSDCIPQIHNHGWYTAVLEQALRTPQLTSAVWPARGLVKSIMNAERILERRRITLLPGESTAEAPLYCAYSGERLHDGEECWHLRLVMHSGARYQKWQKKQHLPAVPHHDPLFRQSVRAYLIKCRVTSVCSLFYAPLPAMIATDATVPLPRPLVCSATRGGLPPNRQFCVNTLWLLMNQLRNFIQSNGLAPYVWQEEPLTGGGGGGGDRDVLYECYSGVRHTLHQMMDALQDNELHFQRDFRTLLIGACFGEPFMRRLCNGEMPEEYNGRVKQYSDMVREAILDFCDLQFHFTSAPLTREVVAFSQFNLPLLGVHMDETEQSRKRFVAQHGKVSAPKLRPESQPLLSQLLWLSSKRAAERMQSAGGATHATSTNDAHRQVMDRLQHCLLRHPFLFMSLFEYLFQQAQQSNSTHVRLSGFPDNLTLLLKLRLSINTENAEG